MEQGNEVITLKEFTQFQQEKFDGTVEYAVNEISRVFDQEIRGLLDRETENIRGNISLSVRDIVRNSHKHEETNLMNWQTIILKYDADKPSDGGAKLVPAILLKLQEKFKGWCLMTFYREGSFFIEIDPEFMPVEAITVVDFDTAWESTCKETVQYFLTTITTFIGEQCGKRSSNGAMCINNVQYVTGGISMNLNDGQRIYHEVNASLKESGWKMKDKSKLNERVFYTNKSYDIELIKA